nr:hypothetical protein [Mangrovibacter phragmitis]
MNMKWLILIVIALIIVFWWVKRRKKNTMDVMKFIDISYKDTDE